MSLVSLNTRPSDKVLRQFGMICLIALPVIAWLWNGRPMLAGWTQARMMWIGGFGALGVLASLLGWLKPDLLHWPFVVLSLITWPIGLVVSEILLASLYFVLITPVALLFRLTGRDALSRKIDPSASTYWQPKPKVADIRRYYRQF